MNSIKILDIKIDIISKQETLDKIKNLLLSDEQGKPFSSAGRHLVTTNPEFILETQKNQEFKKTINNSWLSVADGYGIRLASTYWQEIRNSKFEIRKNLLGRFFIGLKIAWWGISRNNKKLNVVKEVVTGTDLVAEIINLQNTSYKLQITKVFLLGGYGDTSRLAAENLKQRFNNLKISYSFFEVDDPVKVVNNAKPDILFVALNHPRAQIWINDNLSKMPSVKLAIGVGGAFDYISGKIKRAPASWQGFEWLYRLIHQPKRWRRIWNAWIKFSWLVFVKSNKK